MLGQCLKMASENKITPQNTWQLQLIEHLPELIREEGGAQTNFQVRLGGAAVCSQRSVAVSLSACMQLPAVNAPL